jgi:hypothetical protein
MERDADIGGCPVISKDGSATSIMTRRSDARSARVLQGC